MAFFTQASRTGGTTAAMITANRLQANGKQQRSFYRSSRISGFAARPAPLGTPEPARRFSQETTAAGAEGGGLDSSVLLSPSPECPPSRVDIVATSSDPVAAPSSLLSPRSLSPAALEHLAWLASLSCSSEDGTSVSGGESVADTASLRGSNVSVGDCSCYASDT
eukprot:CAMPEP_0172641894 /NCGR_PEP_ID=MMETSP1068-20121228/229580_1 /TAXON_ID=35684 /ORGANISM="Pseudopedinella elastica, Strain CCMP716" /LENGTH=164 /DNA_ID=CAMNT_0013455593 /DNA_START=217 /DNA_END=707 /DNA_ORIENTATION=-